MSTFPPISLLLLLLLVAVAVAGAGAGAPFSGSPSSPPSNGTTVYALLTKFALPPGLLPDTVTAFSVEDNGSFVVELAGPCYVDFEYLVYYDPRITGVVKYGSIEDLKGIQVRRFFIWFDVEAIKVDLPPGDFIYFQLSWITKKLSMEQFETVHSCRADLRLADRAKKAAQGILGHLRSLAIVEEVTSNALACL